MDKIKTVLVTGANGRLGRRIVAELLRKDYEIRAHYRTWDKVKEHCPAEAIPDVGDITSPEWMNRSFEGVDCVIHCAALVSLRPGRDKEMQRVNVDGTRNVVAACKAAGVRRLIHISTVAAVGGSEDGRPLDESAEFNLDGFGLPYFRTKHEAEEIVLAASGEDLHVISLNPSIIIYPPDATITEYDRQKFPHWLPFYFDFGINLVYADDVVEAIVSAIENGKAGERYLLTGANLDTDRFFHLTEKYLGLKKPPIRIPVSLLMPPALLSEFLFGLRNLLFGNGKGPRLCRGMVRLAHLRFFYTSEKAQRDLGFNSRPIEEVIDSILSYPRIPIK